ncbi:MAG: hypothetical protein N2444_10795 [Methylocystis sp.]|nr:hypothetical protein [Methylocystis sp.]
MRLALVKDGVVDNVIEADADFSMPGFDVIASDIAGPGWTYDGARFAPPVAQAPPPATVGFLDFMNLFTQPEQAALVNSADTQVKLFMAQSMGVGEIDLGDPRVAAALDYLVAAGILAASRKTPILAGVPASV